MKDFAGQVALITGAGGGIGGAVARALAARGADLCLVARTESKLKALADGLKGGGKVMICPADLTRNDDLRRLQSQLMKEFEKVDILVHGMGTISLGTVESAPMADFDRQIDTNARAPYELTQLLLPLLIQSRGQIVFINSSAGVQRGRASLGQYGASKHALKVIADSLRDELNDKGVRVLSVYPGRTATLMQARLHREEGKTYHPKDLLQPEDIAEMVLAALALPRTAEVTDIHIRPMLIH